VEEIKSLLDIVTVIDHDVSLHSLGGGEYAGTIGQTGSSGESLKVNQKQQVWKDFKNNRGGDVFDWVGYINGLDARGKDFPEVLRITADLAGVELAETTEEERNAAKENADIHNLFTEAADVYHDNLTPELYDYIFQKWGIDNETVDQLRIGYAKTGRNLKDLDTVSLKKSGLLYVNSGMMGGEVFQGRITFPYWKNGKVVYLIGRQTAETPKRKDGSEPPKYQKLLVHSDRFNYVSTEVQNSYFYGEDSLRGSDYCIITEGVADCISMLQAGFPCISPVTVQFREKDHPKLISLAEELKQVYICNDNEANQAGLKGALSTAEALESAGIETRIIELPKPEGIDKIDIADYMKEHTSEDFRELIDSSVRLWNYKLNQQVIPKNSSVLDKLSAFRAFLPELDGMAVHDRVSFLKNDVRKRFELEIGDIKQYLSIDTEDQRSMYDLDSVSGRNAIYREFADEYISEHHVKCINGKLRMYKDGIYPESNETIDFIKTEIMNIGLSHGVNLAENNITATLKVIELSTRARVDECEPNRDNVIVVNNGILNLKTWKLEEFSPDKIYFSKTPIDYDVNAPVPTTFLRYIDTCFKGNEAQKDILQELFGYTLIKNYKYQYIFYLLGPGGNGKGITIALLRMLHGKQNTASASLFQLTDHQQTDYHVAELYGKHINICGDVGKKPIENTETLKKLTSNTDLVTARVIRERPFEFINYAKIIVAQNRLAKTNAFTTGDKRRNMIISFDNMFSETKQEIIDLQNVIRDNGELPGILLWSIEGLKRLEANHKFSDTRTIAERALEYDKKSNPVRYYFDENLEEAYGNIVPNVIIYNDFNTFRKENHAAELDEHEIKGSILKECYDAGWSRVENKSIRVSSLPEETRKCLKEFGYSQTYIRCFFGIRIVDKSPIDPELKTYANPPEDDNIEDLSVYSQARRDIITYANGKNYNGIVENNEQFVQHFLKENPGYAMEPGQKTITQIVEKAKAWGFR
jgi:DNA primase catalytic core